MYINFNLLKEYNINPGVVLLMQAIKQNSMDDMGDHIAELGLMKYAGFLEDNGHVKFVKPKKKDDTEFQTVRLTEKGKEFLETVTIPNITSVDITLADHLMEVYLKQGERDADENGGMNERSIGNRKKVRMYVSQFRQFLSLTPKQMYWLCILFVVEYKFTKVLEKIFFDSGKNHYGKFVNNIEDSKLYQFYVDNLGRVEAYWKLKIKE